MIRAETIRKISITLTFIFGMIIFGGMLLFKVEVWADKIYSEVETCRTSLDWNDYLYRQTVMEIIEKKQSLNERTPE